MSETQQLPQTAAALTLTTEEVMARRHKLFRLAPPLADDPHFSITSDPRRRCNCMGWAAGLDVWMQPEPQEDGFWPLLDDHGVDLSCFVRAYRALGFERCDDAHYEPDYDKIVLYAGTDDVAQHAARLVSGDGIWSSKIAWEVDILHSLDSLAVLYGSPRVFLRRSRRVGPC